MRGKTYRRKRRSVAALGLAMGLLLSACEVGDDNDDPFAAPASSAIELPDESPLGDGPAINLHLDQADLAAGEHSFPEIFARGKLLFDAKFNKLDGQGRPSATGNGAPTARDPANDPGFLRTSGTDANACAGCHNEPRGGGAGEFVANVFVLAQVRDPVTFDTREANERNTLGMFGSGAIELLGREITDALLAIRAEAAAAAVADNADVSRSLTAKGISFGTITARPDGSFDTSQVEGVDADLIIRPFHQKGVVRSLREFTVNAMNHHHGMQAVERFGMARTGSSDHDQDGVVDELTVGDITAATIYQAALAVPGVVVPATAEKRAAVVTGRATFEDIGCASCHVPALVLDNPVFCEPYGRNPPGTFSDTAQAYCFDLTRKGETPLLTSENGQVLVRAFTDLKRHVICDTEKPWFCNETIVQGGVPTDQFITRKLWDVGNSAPYGHRGDLTTLTDAILSHGGEARDARLAFEALSAGDRAEVVEFLKSLQVLRQADLADR